MRVVYVTKAVDEDNPFVATQVRWIRALARQPEIDHVTVLTPKVGRVAFPENVVVEPLPRGWARRCIALVGKTVFGPRADFAFVAQGGGPYPALLLPAKVLRRRPLYQWKAHPALTPRMRFYARWCDDLIFTPTRGSFPMALDSVRVVGHGIDTELFRPHDGEPDRDLIVLGRIAPVKRLEPAIRAVAFCRDHLGATVRLDVVGPCAPKDEAFLRRLQDLVTDLGLEDVVSFSGPVHHREVPALLSRYRGALNLSRTAFDKAAGEAMAMGVPVIAGNAHTIGLLPPTLVSTLAVDDDDIETLARAFHTVTAWDADDRQVAGAELRAVIERDHSLDAFFRKILGEITADIDGGHPAPSVLQS